MDRILLRITLLQSIINMKNQLLPTLFIMISLLGCNNSGNKNNEQILKEPEAVKENQHKGWGTGSSCFLYATDRDTVFLQLNPPLNGKVIGDLSYFFYEKDGNVGQIEGEIHGDTLFADYIFLSEGLTSVREVAFLLGEDQVKEGYGDVEEQDGKMVFRHRDSLDFSNGLAMPKVPCEQLE